VSPVTTDDDDDDDADDDDADDDDADDDANAAVFTRSFPPACVHGDRRAKMTSTICDSTF
jgi:hypothetical protein